MPKPLILVQAGHLAPREPGFESGTGAAGEQELVDAIRVQLVGRLKRDKRFRVRTCNGKIKRPLPFRCDIFLSLHGDGSANPDARGHSYGWPVDEPKPTRLLELLAGEYTQLAGVPPHHADNYTGALRHYYGYSRVIAGAKVLIEHGFLSNPDDRAWMFARTAAIAAAHHRALEQYFGMTLERLDKRKPLPGPRRKPAWFWPALAEFLRRRKKAEL